MFIDKCNCVVFCFVMLALVLRVARADESQLRQVARQGPVVIYAIEPIIRDYDAQGIIEYSRLLRDWPEDQLPSKKPVPVIPRVNRNDDSWKNGEPIFRVSHPETSMTASGWIGITDENLMLRVVVREEKFVKAPGEGKMESTTNADCLAVLFDATGAGRKLRPYVYAWGPRETFAVNNLFVLAMTDDGPALWRKNRGWWDKEGDKRVDYPASIERNEKQKLTTYELHLPWPVETVQPGVVIHPSIAVQVKEAGARWNYKQQWGGGTTEYCDLAPANDGMFVHRRQHTLQRLCIGDPPSPRHLCKVLSGRIWDHGDYVRYLLLQRKMDR